MADQPRPDVTGKGPALIREALAEFKEIDGALAGLSTEAQEKIKSALAARAQDIEPLLSRAYMKTVKAGEVSWACKQLAGELKQSVQAGSEADALTNLDKLGSELDGLIHKVKTFVVRMT